MDSHSLIYIEVFTSLKYISIDSITAFRIQSLLAFDSLFSLSYSLVFFSLVAFLMDYDQKFIERTLSTAHIIAV